MADVVALALSATLDLRHRVLRPGGALDTVRADDDPAAHQVCAVVAGKPVACANVRPEAAPWCPGGQGAWRLRGVATDPEHRRRGLAADCVRACQDHARDAGGVLVWCNARLGAVGLYEALGWWRHGPEFTLPEIGGHVVMWRPLG